MKFLFEEPETFGDDLTAKELDSLAYSFITENSFAPLYSLLGSDITAIEKAPNNNIIMIDKSASSLIIFDMLKEFKAVDDSPIR
jgi:hypothetical protein